MAVSEERLNQLYAELFGRSAEDAGIEYWMGTGLSGEELRDNLIYSARQAEEGRRQDYESYLARQAQLARGTTPVGYGPSVSEEAFMAMQEELAGLRALLEGSGRTGTAPVTVGASGGQPVTQGAPQAPNSAGTYSSGSMAGTVSEQPNPYSAPLSQSSLPGYIPPTPEMLDAYRFQQYYNQDAVAPVDQGIGQLSYFGIPPSQIQATLSGF